MTYFYRALLTWDVPTHVTEDDPEEAYLSVADSFVDLIVYGTENDLEKSCSDKGPLRCEVVEGTSREAVEAATYAEPSVELSDGSKSWLLGKRPTRAGAQYQLMVRQEAESPEKLGLEIYRAANPRTRIRSLIKKTSSARMGSASYTCRLCNRIWSSVVDDSSTAEQAHGHIRWCVPTTGIDLIEKTILSKEKK